MSAPGQLDLGTVRVTKRSANTYRPELSLTRGPAVLGQAGVSWSSLLGDKWALAWLKGAGLGLALYQLGAGEWQPVPADLPTLPDTARHVSCCFDQSANVVLAWEDQGAVYVRQFDPVVSVYVVRGPFPGHDPVLMFDALPTGDVPGSDVALFLLSPDGLQVHSRLQHDLYAVDHLLFTLAAPGVLDQALNLPYTVQLVGEVEGQPLTLLSEFYPIRERDALGADMTGLSSGAYLVAFGVQAAGVGPDVMQSEMTALMSGAYLALPPPLSVQSGPDGTRADMTALQGGQYINNLTLYSASDAGITTMTALQGGRYIAAVISRTTGPDQLQASMTALTGGRYT